MKNKTVKKTFSIIMSVIMLFTAMSMLSSAASYPKIPALKISRIYQDHKKDNIGLCYWCSVATVQGYCLENYTYGGKTNSYRNPGTDYCYISKADAVSKKIGTYNGNANDPSNLNSFPYPMTLINSGLGNNTATYQKIYDQLKLGKPVVIYTGSHASVVIAYNGSSSTLEASGFTVMQITKDGNSWTNSKAAYDSYANNPQSNTAYKSCYVTLSSWLSSQTNKTIAHICYPKNAVNPSATTNNQFSSDTNSYFSSISVTGITENNARIIGKLSKATNVKQSGFYIGTSASSLKKNGKYDGAFNGLEEIAYTMNNYGQTLSPGTTYYYKLYYIDSNGTERCSPVNWFKTKSSTNTQFSNLTNSYFSSISVTNITETNARIIGRLASSTNVKQSGFYIGTSSDSLTKNSKYDGAFNGLEEIAYTMNNYGQTLSPGTTYYYKLYYIDSNGTERCSPVNWFKTNGTAVVTPSLDRIEIATLPSKTVYEVNDNFEPEGLTVNTIYTDGTIKTVTEEFSLSPLELTAAGTQKITVTYNGKTTSFNIMVNSDHSYTSVVTDPDCTTDGTVTYTCDVCGYSYTTVNTPATGHKYGNWNVTKEATCAKTGTKEKVCSVCGDKATETIEKTAHDYTVSDIVEATCNTDGYTTYVCVVCGNSYRGDIVKFTGHTDCDSDGICDICNSDINADMPDDPAVNCTCNCHKSGIVNFFWKISNFFHKLFGMTKYRYCSCGKDHWSK